MPALFFGGKKVELPDRVFLSNIKKWILEKWKFESDSNFSEIISFL